MDVGLFDEIASKRISSAKKRALIFTVLFVAIAALYISIAVTYANPIKIQNTSQLGLVSPLHYYELRLEDAYNPGYYYGTEGDIKADYYIGRINDTAILLEDGSRNWPETLSDSAPYYFTGTFRYQFGDDYEENIRIFMELGVEYDEAKEILYRHMISDYSLPAAHVILFALAVIIIYQMIVNNRRISAARRSVRDTPDELKRRYQSEASRGLSSSGVTITPGTILIDLKNDLLLKPAEDLVWVYGTITTHRTNGIPTGKTYVANMYFDGEKNFRKISCGKDTVDQLIENIHALGIRAFTGYDADLDKTFRKEREQFLSMWHEFKAKPVEAEYEAAADEDEPEEAAFESTPVYAGGAEAEAGADYSSEPHDEYSGEPSDDNTDEEDERF